MTTSGRPKDAFDGSRHDIDGLSVFCVDTAPATSSRPTVVAVHGIPESSLAWRDVAAAVGDSARMVIPDKSGRKFGRPTKLNAEEAALARRMKSNGETAATICRTLGIGKTTLYRYLAEDEIE